MKLIEALPVNVEIEGVEYPINADFRTSIQFELLIQEEVDDVKVLTEMLRLYYGKKIPSNIPEAIEKALWFYCGGEEKRTKEGNGRKEKFYSFDSDGGYIYAAFMEQYGVNLTKDNLHWWEFRSMFQSLSDKTKFNEIVGYRAVEISSDMSKKEKEFLRKMKKIYALPKNRMEEERMNDIRERLRNGESIESVFGE